MLDYGWLVLQTIDGVSRWTSRPPPLSFRIAIMPWSPMKQLAISDDGSLALIKTTDNGDAGLWVVGSANDRWRIPVDQPSAATFFPNSHHAVVADEATRH